MMLGLIRLILKFRLILIQTNKKDQKFEHLKYNCRTYEKMFVRCSTMLQYYQKIETCVKYQVYEFKLPENLSEECYQILRTFIQTFGDNHYPLRLKVLHLQHSNFFIDFPDYGFPVFKVSFYKQTPLKQVDYYLNIINTYMNNLITI